MNFFSLTVFGGNLLADNVHSSVTMDRHVQACQWTGSISLLTWVLLWESACSVEGCGDTLFSYYSYCASVYVRVVSQHGVKVSLWASKCRLAPSKSYTIPNLEWMSCLLLSKLIVIAKEVVECEVDLSGVLLIRQWSGFVVD